MPFDQSLFDQSLFDDDGNPLYPDRIYLPAVYTPCTKYVRLPSIDEGELGAIELQTAIYLSGIGGTERFGRIRLILSIILASVDGGEAVSDITVTPGDVTVRLPSLQEPECG